MTVDDAAWECRRRQIARVAVAWQIAMWLAWVATIVVLVKWSVE
jgi:hypothetical protein